MAESHRPHVHCAAGKPSCERNSESIESVIRSHNSIGNHTGARNGVDRRVERTRIHGDKRYRGERQKLEEKERKRKENKRKRRYEKNRSKNTERNELKRK